MFNCEIPIYVSVTSIFKNQDVLFQTLQSITKQTLKPEKIFVYLSEEPSFFDDGFKEKQITEAKLSNLIRNNSIIEINWGKEMGPLGKLLPLLKDKWEEDCIIITIDDDTVYDSDLVKNLVKDYNEYKCVINYRGFTPKFDIFENFNYMNRDKTNKLSLYNFPTGKGSILYKPEFFHKTDNLIFNDDIYLNCCDKQDDIWFYVIRVLNNIQCYISTKKWQKQNLVTKGLYHHYNSKGNNNTVAFKKTIEKLKQLGYNF